MGLNIKNDQAHAMAAELAGSLFSCWMLATSAPVSRANSFRSELLSREHPEGRLQLGWRSEAAQILFREVDVFAFGGLLRGECLCEDLAQSFKEDARRLLHGVFACVRSEEPRLNSSH